MVTQNATTDVRFEQFIQCFGIIFGVDPGVIFDDYQDILVLVDTVTESRRPYTSNWITVQPDNTTMCGRNG